ncbi:MAG: insulinase family protein [Candidatus Aminicenantes bacterium]|nr:MAG: insulinase family protein [Candidatus Aminicenantes bacterium]
MITREDVRKFYEIWFRPNNATIIVVGDTSMDEIMPKLNDVFNRWNPKDIPEIKIIATKLKNKSVVYLMDRPNSSQCGIIAAQLINSRDETKEVAIDIAHSALAGSSTKSRIGMNLRENKNWSYMTYSFIVPTKGQRYYVIYSTVQTDKTAESINEIIKEMRGFVGDFPINKLEFESTKKGLTLTLPGELETGSDIIGKIVPIIRFGLPIDYYDYYVKKVNKLTLYEVAQVSKEIYRPDNLVWIVVGDKTKIEEKIKQLDIGEVISINDKGNPIK